ncbi:MAG: glycosyltransferase family 39 protein [Galbibacter orientalis]|uniref:ArnT family glycosyltransferase n=1 Tax=Galbibacter orientalis TaxID=453852 RepID=UPI003002B3AB
MNKVNAVVSRKVKVIALFCFVAIILISFLKVALEWEDAEQAYYSQWFRLGYDDQPPLYTWVQILINKCVGLNRFSLAGLRAFWFSGTLIMFYKLATKFVGDKLKAEVGVFLLFLIPVFIDFNFRRLSHTSMMCFFSVSLYYVFSLLIVSKSYKNYILFGVILVGGILTKYNFLLILPAFGIIALFDVEAKQVLWNRKILLSVLLTCVLISPHLYWLFENKEYLLLLKESMEVKTKSNTLRGVVIITPFFSFLKSFINLIALSILLFSIAYFRKEVALKSISRDWFSKLFIIQLSVTVLIFVGINSSKISDRWLLPLFLPFFILLLNCFQFKKIEAWKKWSMRVFIFIIFLQIFRTPVEKIVGIDSSVHHSFSIIADKLDKFSEKQWNLPDVTYAGSVKFERPNKIVYSADDFTLPRTKIDSSNTIFVLKEKQKGFLVKDSVNGFGEAKETVYFCLKQN